MFYCFNVFNKKSSSLSTDSLEYTKFNLENVSGNFVIDTVFMMVTL